MNYEKKYKEALKKAKSMIDDLRKDEDILAISNLESMFPELKENVDEWIEKIRKDIISYLSNRQITSIAESSAIEIWIDCLERQNEQVVISHKFNVGDWIVSKWGGIYQIKEVMSGSYNLLCTNNAEEINSITQVDNNSRLLCIDDIKKLEKQDKPKLAESEDEKIRKALIRYHQSTLNIDGIKGEKILAWLEKQGEQNSKCDNEDIKIMHMLMEED